MPRKKAFKTLESSEGRGGGTSATGSGLLAIVLIAIIAIAFGAGVGLGALLFYPGTATPLPSPTALQAAQPSLQEIASQEVLYSTMRVLAVRGDTGKGVVGHVTAEIRPGKGRVLINTNPFVEPDTQQSAEMAVKIAQLVTNNSLKDRDVIFSFSAESQLVGGPSAGAAMAIATIAALEKKTLRADVALTGTIEADGRIGFVEGVIEKAEAAAQDGVKTFLVPKGLEQLAYYEPHVQREQHGLFIIERVHYVAKKLDLNNYTTTQFGMRTEAVATIYDALKYFF